MKIYDIKPGIDAQYFEKCKNNYLKIYLKIFKKFTQAVQFSRASLYARQPAHGVSVFHVYGSTVPIY